MNAKLQVDCLQQKGKFLEQGTGLTEFLQQCLLLGTHTVLEIVDRICQVLLPLLVFSEIKGQRALGWVGKALNVVSKIVGEGSAGGVL